MDAAVATIGHNSAIPAYAEFLTQLEELRATNKAATFDYGTPRGNRDARSHVHALRKVRAALDAARKEEKAESLKYGRLVDEQAKVIKVELDEMIDLHAKPLQEIEDREEERIEQHKANLAELKGAGEHSFLHWQDFPLDALKDRLAEVEAEPLGKEHWEEFALEAAEAKDFSIAAMRFHLAKREKHDAEQAELERLRTEAAERKRADREEELRKEGERAAAAEAERKTKQERERAAGATAAAKEASERRELELRLAAETAEKEKAEAETRAATAAKETEERLAREATENAEKEAAETAKREADKQHRAKINRAALKCFMEGGLTKETATLAITLIAKRAIPNIRIAY